MVPALPLGAFVPPSPAELEALSRTAAEKLLVLLAPSGGVAGSAPATVALGFGELQARCQAFDVQNRDGGVGVAIGVEVTGPGLAAPVRDVNAAPGATLDEALDHAMETWMQGFYPPLRDALGDDFVQYAFAVTQVNNETEESTTWCVYQSILQLATAAGVHEKLAPLLQQPPIFGRFIEARALPPLSGQELHTLKLEVVGEDTRTVRTECVFDGQPLATGAEIFKDFPWPGPGLQIFRQYWVLLSN